MQPVDYTTFAAAVAELGRDWCPARLEQVFQRDRFTVYLCLRTLERRGWLAIGWHPEAARIHMGEAPPKEPDTFTFSQQLLHQLKGLAIVKFDRVTPWERVVDLQFARRPGDPVQWHLYVEIMGKYSNVILCTAENVIVTAAHQVSSQQSRIRPIQTGQPYELPPPLVDTTPRIEEPFESWRDRVGLVPGAIARQLVKSYRGLSSTLARSLAQMADLDPDQATADLTELEWRRLFDVWRGWLKALETETFDPVWTATGYSVVGAPQGQAAPTVQELLDRYYGDRLNGDTFQRLVHQLRQKVANQTAKLTKKRDEFRDRLALSNEADQMRAQADLLMAHLHHWQPGMAAITLPDFETEAPISITLDPALDAVSNAQKLYKKHQKLKRSRQAIEPLLAAVTDELNYLERVETALLDCDRYRHPDDLAAIEEIRDELISQGYLADPGYRRPDRDRAEGFHRYQTPSGHDIWVGRNNGQNDRLTFRLAGDYDLWFHAQEIAGSHVLLRLPPGTAPTDTDLQTAADLAARHSRARHSDAVPVVYTHPRHVYKPKGASPGTVLYRRETVLWANPQRAIAIAPTTP